MLNSQSNFLKAWSPLMGQGDIDTGERIVRLREALGFEGRGGQIGFAKKLEISNSNLNMIENGSGLSRAIAIKLVQAIPGLTLDWLYLGKPEGLPLELQRSLGVVPSPPGKRTTDRP